MRKPFPYFLFALLLFSAQLPAQDTLRAMLAEPFRWKIQKGDSNEIPAAGQSIGSFEILKIIASEKDVFEVLMVAYDTGNLKLPIKMGIPAGAGFPVRVDAPQADLVKDYAPVKEPVFNRPEEKFPLWIPLLVTAVALVAGLLYWLGSRRKVLPVLVETTGAGGMVLLQQVKENWVSGKLNSLQLGEGLVNSLQAQFGIPVKKSTRQLLRVIRRQYADAYNPVLEKVMDQTDAWRFGKQVATPAEGEAAAACLEELFLKTNTNSNRKVS